MLRLLRLPQRLRSTPDRQRGQALPLFVLMIFVLTGSVAIVTDVSWFWVNSQRMQRAADAASLAGAVYLPGNVPGAYAAALASAKQNGYIDGTGGVTVVPAQEHPNTRRLDVTVSGPVNTFFARVFGMNRIQESAKSKAEFALPVPMGSPQNYYGVGYFIGTKTNVATNPTTWVNTTGPVTAPVNATTVTGAWTTSAGAALAAVQLVADPYLLSKTNGQQEELANYGQIIPTAADSDHPVELLGLEVLLNGTRVSSTCASTTISTELSWNNGAAGSWSSKVNTPLMTTTVANRVLGAPNSTVFGTHTFTAANLVNGKFRVRLTANKGCGTASIDLRVNQIQVRVTYRTGTITYTTSYSLIQDQAVPGPHGEVLAYPQKFWGAMQSQGAPSIQGDAYMTRYNTRTSSFNDGTVGLDPDTIYDPVNYYNYGVDVASGGGEVWIYDPGFCDTTTTAGVGENWTTGGPNGYSSQQPVSAYFDLFNTKGTPYDYGDDGTPVATSANTFAKMSFQDKNATTAAGGALLSGVPDCSAAAWHNQWWRLASGLPAGKYRLHTYSTDPSSATDQNNTTALNAFAFWASSGARIYGLGAMEAYARMPKDAVSTFYLAQIEALHAGKTMDIDLWDPGDTGNMTATLEILAPTGSGFAPVLFAYQGEMASEAAVSCNGRYSGSAASVVTANGSSLFNGCWLTITVVIPTNYTAPIDPVSGEAGWWKIRYTMSGGTTVTATDLTTWQVNIRGNPVHLVR